MTRTLSVKLPDGTTATRQSDRPYLYAVLVVHTAEQRDLLVKKAEADIAEIEASIRKLEAESTDADHLEWEEAKAAHDWLCEKVIEDGRDGKPYETQRWLTKAYRDSIGDTDGRPYGAEPSALNVVQAASRRVYATTFQKLIDQRQQLAYATGRRDKAAAMIVRIDGRAGGTVDQAMDQYPEGCCAVHSWSQSLKGAQDLADTYRKNHPGMHVQLLSDITTHDTEKPTKARAAARVHWAIPIPLQRHGSTIACTGKTWGSRVRATHEHAKVTCPECLEHIDDSPEPR